MSMNDIEFNEAITSSKPKMGFVYVCIDPKKRVYAWVPLDNLVFADGTKLIDLRNDLEAKIRALQEKEANLSAKEENLAKAQANLLELSKVMATNISNNSAQINNLILKGEKK